MGKLTDCFRKQGHPANRLTEMRSSVNGSVYGDSADRGECSERTPLITRPRKRPANFMSFSCSRHPVTVYWSCLDIIEFFTPQALANRKLDPSEQKAAFLGFGETGWNIIGAIVTGLAMFPQGMFGWLIFDKLALSHIPDDYVAVRIILGGLIGFASWKGKKDLIRMFNTFQFISLAHYNYDNCFINPKNWSLNGLVDFVFVLTSALTFAGLSIVAMSSDNETNPGISQLLARFGDPFTEALSVLFGNKFLIGLMAGSSFWSNSIGGQGLVHLATRFYMRLASPVILKIYDFFQHTNRYNYARNEYYNIEHVRQYARAHRSQLNGQNILKIGDIDLTAATLGRWHPFSEINTGEMNDPATREDHYKLQALFRTADASALQAQYEGKWPLRLLQLLALCVAFTYSYWGFENFSPLGLIGLNACAWLFGLSPHVDATVGGIFGQLSFAFLFNIMSFGIIGHDALKLANMIMQREMPIFTLPNKAYRWAATKAGLIAIGGGAPNACQDFIVYDVRGAAAINQAVAADLASALMEYSALVALQLNSKRGGIYLNALDQHLAARRDAVMIKALYDLLEDIPTTKMSFLFHFVMHFLDRNPARLDQRKRSHDQENNVYTCGGQPTGTSNYYGLTYGWFATPNRLQIELDARKDSTSNNSNTDFYQAEDAQTPAVSIRDTLQIVPAPRARR